MVKRPPSKRITRIAFWVIIVFVLAQIAWWMIFHYRYIGQVTEQTLTAWQRDEETANMALRYARDEAALRAQLEDTYPHLLFDGERFVLDQQMVEEFEARQESHVRMFAFEGPFFGLVVLIGLYIIAHSLRTERELKRRQQNFLSAVTHEFRTPIGTLKLLIETALYRPLGEEKQRTYLERMESELARLEATSEQVLASARLEQTGTPPQLEAADLNEVVRKTLHTLRPSLEARGAKLHVRYTPEPLPVSLDPSAFSIVLGNLLDNAVKYTPADEKPVRVWLEKQGHVIALHVDDEGVGIKNEEVKRIFDKFYRTGDELTRESTGVGLGLYLVKSITEAMNGWVRCEAPLDSATDHGSRFSVMLPERVTQESTSRPRLARSN